MSSQSSLRDSSTSLAFLPRLVEATSRVTSAPPGDFDDPEVQAAHIASESLVSGLSQLSLASSRLITGFFVRHPHGSPPAGGL